MRVCLVSGHYPPMRSGVGDHTALLAAALAGQSCEVTVLTSEGVPASGPNPRVLPQVPRWTFPQLRELRRFVAANRFDIVHIQYPSWGDTQRGPAVHLLPVALRHAGTRIVFTLHEANRVRRRWLARPLLSALLADAIICVDEADARLVRRLTGRRPTVIPIGATVHPCPGRAHGAVRADLGVDEADFVFVYFGAARATTGIRDALDAFATVAATEGRAQFVIVTDLDVQGPGDYVHPEDARALRAAINANPARDRIVVKPYLEPAALSEILQACDAGLFPYTNGVSRQRSAVLACFAHGLPVITTAAPDAPPNYIHGENCYLVPPKQPESVAAAMRHVMHAADLRARLAAGGLALAASVEWEKVAARTLELYSFVTRNNR